MASQSAKSTHELDIDSYKKVFAGVVFTIFFNTDSYANPIDKCIPFRNNILHRGMMDYSDEEAKKVYELLVYFIAELAITAISVDGRYCIALCVVLFEHLLELFRVGFIGAF